MKITGYLAMTAAEFSLSQTLPGYLAWMACHFSCYATGLTNLPRSLPADSMIIVNDRTPVHGHDAAFITEQLLQLEESLRPSCFLLDFQRPGNEETAQIARAITQGLSCPVGVSEHYARELDCPVFLSPPPLHHRLEEYLAAWGNREIWLEAATDAQNITVTPEGSQCSVAEMTELPEPDFFDAAVYSRYHWELKDNAASFQLQRNKEELKQLLEAAESMGVTTAVGLYQQLGNAFWT